MSTVPVHKKLRVALVVPNFRWCEWKENTLWHFIPYGLCLLAAMIEDFCEIKIIDAHAKEMKDVDFVATLKDFRPDIVGITIHMDQYAPSGHYAAKIVKSYDSAVTVVMGGIYATLNPEKAISDSMIDYVVIGEGEYIFRDLLKFFMGKNKVPGKGICYRSNGKIINGGYADFIQDLDALPLPAYHLIDFKKYAFTAFRKSVDNPRQFPYARVFTSRGCPCGCTFCQFESVSGKQFRSRSVANTLIEIQWLKEKYGVKSLVFDDDNMLLDRKRAIDIFKGMISRNLVMPWFGSAVAAFKMDEELIGLMKESGCEYINVAIESSSERILRDIIKKPIKPEYAKRIIAQARKAGIYVAANFMIGLPTETWNEIRQTINFAEEVDADYVKIFNAAPLAHTKLWDICEKKKCFKKGFNPNDISWDVGQTESKDFSARDLTILRAYEWDRINFTDPAKRRRTAEMMNVTEEELLEIRRKTINQANSL